MEIIFSEKAKKGYKKLPFHLKKKADKQFQHLKTDLFYPSLHTKKMQGVSKWESRIDRSYRFTFEKTENKVIVRTIGPHDEGLGKK